MKTITFFIMTLFSYAFCPSFLINKGYAQENSPHITKEFTIEDQGSLIVKTSGGNITVTGQTGNKAKVEMFVKKGGVRITQVDISEALEDFEIKIEKEGNKLIAIAERKEGVKWSPSKSLNISFIVSVPTKINCDLGTSGGSIELEKVIGDHKVRTSGGSLSLKSIRGNLNGHTSGGEIEVQNFKGYLNANTSGGSINVHEAKGEIKVHTSGGSIDLEEVYGSIDASTSGGSIDADIKELGKYLDLNTSGGSITATIPKGIGLDLDLKGNSVNTKLTNFDGEAKRDKIVGKINGGGIPIKLSTSGGSVDLNYQM